MTDAEAGAAGRLTRQLDAALPQLGYHCLHGVTPTGKSQPRVDHVLIGPGGAFVIDELDLTGEVRAGADGRVWCGGQPLEDRIDDALAHAAAVGQVIGSHVTAIAAIHGAAVKAPSVTRTVHLAPATEVPALVGRRTTYRTPTHVERYAARAREALAVANWTPPTRRDGLRQGEAQTPRTHGGPMSRLLRRRRS